MTPNQVIQHFGTQCAAAEAAGVSQPAVSAWLKRGEVPARRQLVLAHASSGKLTLSRGILPRVRGQQAAKSA
jgi:DNA-binding transcriptional regulator YdaS (Cro superfamily)